MTIRTPHSGSIGLASPDIIAAKHNKLVVIECKSHEKAFQINKDQLTELKKWQEKAGASAYIGWKMSHKPWSFLKLDDVITNNGNIGKKFAEEFGIDIEKI